MNCFPSDFGLIDVQPQSSVFCLVSTKPESCRAVKWKAWEIFTSLCVVEMTRGEGIKTWWGTLAYVRAVEAINSIQHEPVMYLCVWWRTFV